MNISASIKALLNIGGFKQADIMDVLSVNSKQALSNKFTGERWSAADLVKVAEFTGCKLAFVFPDGERIVIGDSGQGVTGGGIGTGLASRGTPVSSDE